MKCNVCDGRDFETSRKGRMNMVCATCGSHERTRVLKLYLDKHDLPKAGMRVLHFAPEEGVARYIQGRIGSRHYETYDIVPKNYTFDFHPARRLDLCTEISLLNNRRYDLIIHNHVLEHLPCNYTMVLLRLHALLKPDGIHAFSIPIRQAMAYSEDQGDASLEERREKFGQAGHVRNFGSNDFERSVGMIFDLRAYSLLDHFSVEQLREVNVVRSYWGPSSACVFFLPRTASPLLASA